MPNIVAFGASSSQNSINRKLAHFAAQQVPNAHINLLDLNDYEMSLYSTDREKEGIPEKAHAFKAVVMAYIGMAYIATVYVLVAYVVMADIVMACKGMGCIIMA